MHKVFPHGDIELKNNTIGDTLKVNGQRLKPYHQGHEIGLVEEAISKHHRLVIRRAMDVKIAYELEEFRNQAS